MKRLAFDSGAFPISYGDEMLRRVIAMHSVAKNLRDYGKWIDDHMGGRVVAFRERLLPQIRAFTDLRGIDVLDFGCGTGSSTVALAECAVGSRITAVDVDAPSLEIARLRFAHHNISSAITVLQIPPIRKQGDVKLTNASVDFILMNGVLEHVVPFEVRDQVLIEMWRLLRPGGLLFISETPNPLWPIDRHTTGLPFIPWLPSRTADRVAVLFKRHARGSNLDARGRRGMTYWEIMRPLRSVGPVEVLNVTRAKNRLLPGGVNPGTMPSFKRRLGTAVLENVLGRLLTRCGIPVVAFGPFIEYLCLRKKTAV